MLAVVERKVILELPLLLKALLGDISVGPKGLIGESEVRGTNGGVYQVVPILVANRGHIDNARGQHGSESRVGDDELIGGEVARRQVVGLAGLVIQSTIILIRVTHRKVVLFAKALIETAVIAPVVIRYRDCPGWNG